MLDKSLCVQLLQAGCFGSLAVALADRAAVRAAVLQFLQCSWSPVWQLAWAVCWKCQFSVGTLAGQELCSA